MIANLQWITDKESVFSLPENEKYDTSFFYPTFDSD